MIEPQTPEPGSAPGATGPDEPTGRRTRFLPRPAVLKRIAALYDEPRYLEIGVNRGTTFHRVPAASKVAVDPVFEFDVDERRAAHPEASYHQVPSDEYFATIVEPDQQFDLIYLDGLHVVEQTLRDLMNALHHLAPRGVIVIDDTRPPTYLASLPDRENFFQVRRWLGEDKRAWMGDVYRLVYFIETFCPHLSYRTIANNHGQTVVWRTRRTGVPERALREVAELTFEQLVLSEEHLRLAPFGQIHRELRADLGL